jgi:hypothetical protein
MGVFSNIKRFTEAKEGMQQMSPEDRSGTFKRMGIVFGVIILAVAVVKGIAYICAE